MIHKPDWQYIYLHVVTTCYIRSFLSRTQRASSNRSTMLLERIYDEGLAQATYLVGCEQTKAAIVVDPGRNVHRFIDAAKHHRMRIEYVTETHIHADFVSGARELAAQTGASLLLSGEGDPEWQYQYDARRTLCTATRSDVGSVRIDVRHTPGHTSEHICFLITDTLVSDQPVGLLSGDFIFVGDVGRPDLLERAAGHVGTMDVLARRLFASIQAMKDLPALLAALAGTRRRLRVRQSTRRPALYDPRLRAPRQLGVPDSPAKSSSSSRSSRTNRSRRSTSRG